MSRSKKQLYAAILALAAIMLLADRAMRGGVVQAASAATARSLKALGVETSIRPTASVAAAPFPGPLPEENITGPPRDIFALDQSTRNRLLGLNPDDTGSGGLSGRRGQGGPTSAALFEQEHRLDGTMVGGGASFAIVDGAWFRIGDRLDHCQVTAITGTDVSWKCADGVATLSVIEDSARSFGEK